MNTPLPHTRTTPRYSSLYDKHVLANWIALIAEDRDLDAVALAALAGVDADTAQAILDGAVGELSLRLLDDVLRAVERRPRCGTHIHPAALRPVHAEGVAV